MFKTFLNERVVLKVRLLGLVCDRPLFDGGGYSWYIYRLTLQSPDRQWEAAVPSVR